MHMQVDTSLVNSLFDGYKLATKELCLETASLSSPIDTVSTSFNTFSYAFSKCTKMFNHLYLDPWSNSVFYCDNEQNILHITKSKEEPSSIQIKTEYKLQAGNENDQRFCCSLFFPASNIALATDGLGKIYLFNTGVRSKSVPSLWNLLKENHIQDLKTPGYIIYSLMEESLLHVLYLSLKTGDEVVSTPLVAIHWLQFNVDVADSKCVLQQNVVFIGKSLPNSCWVDKEKIYLICDDKFTLANNQTLERIEYTNGGSVEEQLKFYTWQQTKELVTVIFEKQNVCEDHVSCTLTSNSIQVSIKDGENEISLNGPLEKEIVTDKSKWVIEDGRLKIVLGKKDVNQHKRWSSVVPSMDSCGSHVIGEEDEKMISEINKNLSCVTTDKEIDLQNEDDCLFNMQQLEECDKNAEEEVSIYSIDSLNGKIETLKNFGSHQWLFEKFVENDTMIPHLCLRYDVDGILWRPTSSNHWKHISTFDAFGYVLASKTEHKFVGCSPSLHYSFITDCTSHVYIYEGVPIKDDGEPSTNKKQYVVNCKPSNNIYGCQATDGFIYVLSDNSISVIMLP